MSKDIIRPRYRILLVDDEIANIQILHDILREDYDISVATSGKLALKLAVQLEPAVILLDMVMPEMSGIDVCEKLRENEMTRKIPIIFVTNMRDSVYVNVGFNSGASDYIYKPVDANVVKARVSVHLQLLIQEYFLEMLVNTDTPNFGMIQRQAQELLSSGHAYQKVSIDS